MPLLILQFDLSPDSFIPSVLNDIVGLDCKRQSAFEAAKQHLRKPIHPRTPHFIAKMH